MTPESEKFIEAQQELMKVSGFWDEEYKVVVIKMIERSCNKEVLKDFGISDFIIHGDKILLNWYRRVIPLSDDQLKERYGE